MLLETLLPALAQGEEITALRRRQESGRGASEETAGVKQIVSLRGGDRRAHSVSFIERGGGGREGRGREARGSRGEREGITGEKKGRRGRSYFCLPP